MSRGAAAQAATRWCQRTGAASRRTTRPACPALRAAMRQRPARATWNLLRAANRARNARPKPQTTRSTRPLIFNPKLSFKGRNVWEQLCCIAILISTPLVIKGRLASRYTPLHARVGRAH
eukprot:scaffold120056_cov60-Phaeocystis_antarctica.AAC.2